MMKRYFRKIINSLLSLSLFLFVLIYSTGCNSIEPPVNGNGQDTTSHNFTWQSWTFGEHSSSVLNDVAIIDENNIWVVGEIYLNDSLGQPDPIAYNAVHWNGNEWIVKKISVLYQSNLITPPLFSVYAFSENDIWMSSGVPINGDGSNWTQYHLFDMGILNQDDGSLRKIWGINSNDIYFVGNKGTIAHYNGTNWQKIESGTDVDINDIWGIKEGIPYPFILCAASNVFKPGEHKILKINNTQVDSINWNTGRRVHSVWFNSQEKLVACGGGVFFGSAPNYNWTEQTDIPLFFSQRVRGKAANDLFVVGDFGLLAHYNGATWKTFPEAATAEIYLSIDYSDNLMVTVGLTFTQAVVQFMFQN